MVVIIVQASSVGLGVTLLPFDRAKGIMVFVGGIILGVFTGAEYPVYCHAWLLVAFVGLCPLVLS